MAKSDNRKLRDQVRSLYAQGQTKTNIAQEVGISFETVHTYIGGMPIPENIKQEIIRQVEAGAKKKDVARAYGYTATTVSDMTPHVMRWNKPISPEIEKQVIELASKGETTSKIVRALGISSTAINRVVRNIFGENATPEQGTAIQKMFADGSSRTTIALKLQIPKFLVDKKIGIGVSVNRFTEDQKRYAIEQVDAGKGVHKVGAELGISADIVNKWFHDAVAGGTAKPRHNKSKGDDPELSWVCDRHPEMNAWRILMVKWIQGERNRQTPLDAFVVFVKRFLWAFQLSPQPADLLRRNKHLPDFFVVACPQSNLGVAYNNNIHRFLNWVLIQPEFADDSSGQPITLPIFYNPIPKLTHAGIPKGTAQSNKLVMPYRMIADLRRRIAQGPNFRDWTLTQGLLGNVQVDGTRAGSDWFDVEESRLDRNDPDCVWRERKRYNGSIVLEMWSPVRWVATLINLQVTARTGQIRMLDSGEADTFIYCGSQFIRNKGPLAAGTERKPRQQGIFRRPDPGEETLGLQLFFNTNKTADIMKQGKDKGMSCPWPHLPDHADDPYYWLQKLRDWQQKYNPIDCLTAWRELPTRRNLGIKSDEQNNEYPNTAFLFRTPETPKEAAWPVTHGTLTTAWVVLLNEYERILLAEGECNLDGSPIRLVYPETSRPVFSPHGLRVSLITHLIIDGDISPILMMKIVGHARFVMTLYYTKPGLKIIQDALANAHLKLEASKDETFVRDLLSIEAERLREHVIFNAEEWTTVMSPNPIDRNPLGWLALHDGICLAGGNTGPVNGNSSIPGCHNGGPINTIKGVSKDYYSPVQGGVRNCCRCRWKCAGKQHSYGLAATFNNRQYHYYKLAERAIQDERATNELRKLKALDEAAGVPFTRINELRAAERRHEAAMQKVAELALDLGALLHTIERVQALPDHSDGTLALALQGDIATMHTILEETNSELLVLAQICEDVEFFSDLDPGTAVYEFAQLLDRAFEREGYPLVLARMSESEKLATANAFMRAMDNFANPNNPLLGRRRVVEILDREESLEATLGINIKTLLPKNCLSRTSKRLIKREGEQ
jgi:DNA invertase Pin-like site-specific DNA recombinase